MEKIDEKTLKDELKKSADSFKEQLEIDVNESLDQIQRIAKITAIAAGGIFIGYSVFRIFFQSPEQKDKKKKKKQNSPGRSNVFQPILKAGAEVASAYLLSIAKQRLQVYLRDLERRKSSINEDTAGDY